MANCLVRNEILHQVGKIVVDFSRGVKFNNDPPKNSWGDTGEKCPPSNTLNLALYINYFSHAEPCPKPLCYVSAIQRFWNEFASTYIKKLTTTTIWYLIFVLNYSLKNSFVGFCYK